MSERDAPGAPSNRGARGGRPRAPGATVRRARVAPPPAFAPARVRALRESLGVSQPVFAAALAVTAGTVASWEQGRSAPAGAARRLLELAEAHPELLAAVIVRG